MTAETLADPVTGANVEQSVPFFCVGNMEASLRYYVEGLGFKMTNKWVVNGEVRWCWLQYGGAALMLQDCLKNKSLTGKPGEGMCIYFICKDALAIYREVTARGIAARRPFVGNSMWVMGLTDPDGYKLYFESPTDAPEETEYSE
jgi:uncharacterized glyoxalase superfamily protein PhnB